jgi:hypothetical protein
MTSFMLSRLSSTSSPNPLSTSSQSIRPVLLTVLQDLERTVSEAGAGETAISVEQYAVESAHPTEVMTVVGHLTEDTTGAPTMLDTALVLASTSSPSQHLAEDVVLEFDATHRLSKLTTAWEDLSAGAASFGELL